MSARPDTTVAESCKMQSVEGDPAEQRKYARIEAALSCSVATATDAFEAQIVNLSKSGAAVVGPGGAAGPGDTVTLPLERQEAPLSVALPGQGVRIDARDEEHVLYGIA